jgi:hypothetical protein
MAMFTNSPLRLRRSGECTDGPMDQSFLAPMAGIAAKQSELKPCPPTAARHVKAACTVRMFARAGFGHTDWRPGALDGAGTPF